jgi:hypothetical protein
MKGEPKHPSQKVVNALMRRGARVYSTKGNTLWQHSLVSRPKSAGRETPTSIFAMPIGGGAPRFVLKDVNIWNVQCARLPSTVCLYSVSKGNTSETFRFDVTSGKRADPPQIDPSGNWSLSPDGLQRAIVGPGQEKIQFRSTSTGESHDLVVKGWNGLDNIDWSADGTSLLTSWHNSQWDSALLNVTLDGRASILLRSSKPEIGSAIPSPDGRLLAIIEASSLSSEFISPPDHAVSSLAFLPRRQQDRDS